MENEIRPEPILTLREERYVKMRINRFLSLIEFRLTTLRENRLDTTDEFYFLFGMKSKMNRRFVNLHKIDPVEVARMDQDFRVYHRSFRS